jgi:hypothetical protein
VKKHLRDCGFDSQPHEVNKVGDVTYRCDTCTKMGTLAEMIDHVVRNQQPVRPQ